MTIALCMTCGETKFGAICPCGKCGVASTGNMELDIAFSDHYLSVQTLKEFGGVIRCLSERTQDPAIRSWAFIKFVSDLDATILQAEVPAAYRERVEHVLSDGALPSVRVEESSLSKSQKTMKEERKKKSVEVALPARNVPHLSMAFLGREQMSPTDTIYCRVDVELTGGRMAPNFRLGVVQGTAFLSRSDRQFVFEASEVVAVRRAFRLLHPFAERPWIKIE